MTKVAIMSDLHIDLNHLSESDFHTIETVLDQNQIDHLHIAGDISNHFHTITLPFLQRMNHHLPTTFNLGNHDLLDLNEDMIQQNDFSIHTFDQGQLLTFSGWYDYSFTPQFSTEELLKTKKMYWFDRRIHRKYDDIKTTALMIDKLDHILHQNPNIKAIAMHFVPHRDFTVPYSYFERFNAFLGSQRFHYIFKKHQIKEVVFGHHHKKIDTVIDNIHYQAHPLGYIREWRLIDQFFEKYPRYRITKHYHLSKRYNHIKKEHLFQTFKKDHFADEIAASLSILLL